MRNALAAEIVALAQEDSRTVLLSGDIGNRLFDGFKKRFPDRFFNCGVAEANMTSMAAGMAMCGLRPITYTITPFNTTRCLEQIRVDVCYHNLPVIIVGVGAGLSYAGLGGTHHACEDIALLRVFPNMNIVCPGDAVEVRLALRAALRNDSPVYLRLGKKNEPVVHKKDPPFEIGKGITVVKGTDVCLLSTGNLLPIAVDVASLLEEQGISTQAVSFHTVKPLDTELLTEIFETFQTIATVEEHSLLGGLGGSVAEWLSDQPRGKSRLCRFGTPDSFVHRSGDQENARKMVGLTPENICGEIIRVFNE